MVKVDSELEGYLSDKGWQWKLVEGGRQVLVKDECPFCGKKEHLYFGSETTKWDCKYCGETGNLLTMKRRLGDIKLEVKEASEYIFRRGPKVRQKLDGLRPPSNIADVACKSLYKPENNEALSYLKDIRGFTDETIKAFKIGVMRNNNGKHIVIPHYVNGELVNVKFRSLPPADKTFSRWKDCPSVLFNQDSLIGMEKLPPRERTVILCEAETDAIAFVQVGFKRVVSSTTGATKGDWPEHWLSPLESATVIYLVYDADNAGDNGALKTAEVLGKHRCKRVTLPMKDAAKLVSAGYGREIFDEAISKAYSYEEEVVRSIEDFVGDMDDWLSQKNPKGKPTGWLSFDFILGGIRPGETTVVTGDTGSGKSTWVTALAYNQILQGVPTLICPFEQKAFEILMKLTGMSLEHNVYSVQKKIAVDAAKSLCSLPVYLIDKQGPTPLGEIKDAIYSAVMKYGVKVVVLDHLHFFLMVKGNDERTAIKETMIALEVWAKDLGIHIVIVVHPRTLGTNSKGEVFKVTLDHLKGASDIKQICDNAVRVHRCRENGIGSANDDTEITVMKCRSPAGKEGVTFLKFGEGETYSDSTDVMGQTTFNYVADEVAISKRTGVTSEEEQRRWDEPF
jgi:twinkle protein